MLVSTSKIEKATCSREKEKKRGTRDASEEEKRRRRRNNEKKRSDKEGKEKGDGRASERDLTCDGDDRIERAQERMTKEQKIRRLEDTREYPTIARFKEPNIR